MPYYLAIVDNSGYKTEVVVVLPHPYEDQTTAETAREDVEVHKPSTRFAAWRVMPGEWLAEAGWPQ